MSQKEDKEKYQSDNPILDMEKKFRQLEEDLRDGTISLPQVGGEANTYSSSGAGVAVIQTKSLLNLPFKSFVGGAFIAINDLGNEIEISLSGVPGVEAIAVNDLSDADMSGLVDGDIIRRVGGEFVPAKIENHTDVAANTAVRHNHTNKTVLDKIDEPSPPSDGFPLVFNITSGKYEAQDRPTAAEIKSKYESNADTNALTNALVSDIANNKIHAAGATTDHSDFGGSPPSNGQVPTYNTANGQYEPATPGTGEDNDGANIGTGGIGVFKAKNGLNLEFKKVFTTTGIITIIDNTGDDQVDFGIDLGAFNAAVSILSTQVTDKGDPNGMAPLDGAGKLAIGFIPDGVLRIKGNWDADTNTPTLADGVGTQGDRYRVSTGGATSLDGIATWGIEDIAWFDGSAWRKIDSSETPAPVDSVNGKTGVVVIVSADIGDLESTISANADVAANTTDRHSHANDAVLDALSDAGSGAIITVGERSDLGLNTASRHSHTNKAIIDLINDAGSGDIITVSERADLVAAKAHADGDLDGHADVDYSVVAVQFDTLVRDGGGLWKPGKIPASTISNLGLPNGTASLDGSGHVPLNQLPSSILDSWKFKGVWDANTNTPTLADGVGAEGDLFLVNQAGGTVLDGSGDWEVGDWAVFSNSVWNKIDNSDKVSSVNGKTGVVVIVSADIADIESTISANTDVAANTVDRHNHANKVILDTIAEPAPPEENEALSWDGGLGQYIPKPVLRTIVVRLASGVNIAGFAGGEILGLAPPTAIDGSTLQNDDEVILFGQTNGEENGLWIYDLAGEKLTRIATFNATNEILRGQEVAVEEGIDHGGGKFINLTDKPTVDTDVITFLKVADVRIQVTGNDTTPGYASDKFVGSTSIQVQVIDPGANEKLQISLVGGVAPGAGGWLTLSSAPSFNSDVLADELSRGGFFGDFLYVALVVGTGGAGRWGRIAMATAGF